jgi:hypothetical protein
VVIVGGLSYIQGCLEALMRQTGVQEFEIVVPCDGRIADISELQQRFSTVRFLQIEGCRTYAELRTLGVRQCHGAIIALTEDHCTPQHDWCARILEAHTRSQVAIGGVVDKREPDTAVNWALYLMDYVRYMRPMTEGLAHQLTDCNVSYKRPALEAIAAVWQREFHEPAVHAALQAGGVSLWLVPTVVVHQQRCVRLWAAIRDRYIFGRLFGSGRVQTVSALWRLIYAGCAVLLPALLVGRVAGQVVQKRRCVGAFVRALPAVMLLSIVWACGEFVGYLTGCPNTSLTPQTLPDGKRVQGNKGAAV